MGFKTIIITLFCAANFDEMDWEVTTTNPLPELIPNHRKNESTIPLRIWPFVDNS